MCPCLLLSDIVSISNYYNAMTMQSSYKIPQDTLHTWIQWWWVKSVHFLNSVMLSYFKDKVLWLMSFILHQKQLPAKDLSFLCLQFITITVPLALDFFLISFIYLAALDLSCSMQDILKTLFLKNMLGNSLTFGLVVRLYASTAGGIA